jgi:hypothetical protein
MKSSILEIEPAGISTFSKSDLKGPGWSPKRRRSGEVGFELAGGEGYPLGCCLRLTATARGYP